MWPCGCGPACAGRAAKAEPDIDAISAAARAFPLTGKKADDLDTAAAAADASLSMRISWILRS